MMYLIHNHVISNFEEMKASTFYGVNIQKFVRYICNHFIIHENIIAP